MTLNNKEIDKLITDNLIKLSRAKQQNDKAMIERYEYEIRLLEVAYH